VMEHLNEQMDVIEESLRLVVERCDALVVQMRDKKPVEALQTIALILGALQPYKQISQASKILDVLEGAMLATDGME